MAFEGKVNCMSKIFYIVPIIWSNSFFSFSQNLVPNPYFDELSPCEYISRLHGLSQQSAWFEPAPKRSALVQLFHECFDHDEVKIPHTALQYTQYPKKGKGMLSLLVFPGIGYSIVNYDTTYTIRGFAANELLSTLDRNDQVFVRFYVMPKAQKIAYYIIKSIGLYLYSDEQGYLVDDRGMISEIDPQITYQGPFIDDFNQWITVQGKYMAKGGEQYIAIGNFKPDEETEHIFIDTLRLVSPETTMYFIDDVLVEVFNPLPDTVLVCAGEKVELNAAFHEADYYWNTGGRDSVLAVQRSGTYHVTAMIDTLEFTDTTIVVFAEDFQPETVIDTFYCSGERIVLHAPVPGQYLWSTGAVTSGITVGDKGNYQLTVTNDCGRYEFEYQVQERDCDCELEIPNAFSPNGDGQNDYLEIINRCRYRDWKMESFFVYDKWGGQVYRQTGGVLSWDGHIWDGSILPSGVYAYRLNVVFKGQSREPLMMTGSVQIIR